MSEETTQGKPESIAKVLMEYFRDYEMMKAKKLPWPTPEYLLRLLKRVFKASTAERSAMSKGNTNSKEDFWEEASKLIPDSTQITTLFYELELIWSNAIEIKEQAESMRLRGVLRKAREIERLAFRWMELSKTLQADERLRLRGSLAACWGQLCNLCYDQCRAFHHQPKCVTSVLGCPILVVCKTALGLPLNERHSDGETHDEFLQRLCPSQKCALCGGVEECKLWRVFGDCEGVWDMLSGRLYDYIRKEAIEK